MRAGRPCWISLPAAPQLQSDAVNKQEQQLMQALEGFLTAFRNLDWEPFIAAFAAEATVFFPFADAPRRATGAGEIKAIFAPLFASRRSRQADASYLRLDPVYLQITIAGKVALVSFHLHDSAEEQAILCRRTMVWVDEDTQWRILHLHASNLPLPNTVEA